MNLTTRIRVFPNKNRGTTTTTLWSSDPAGRTTRNGQLTFRTPEWEHFRSLLVQNRDTRFLMQQTISFMEHFVEKNSNEVEPCKFCGAPIGEMCEEDCSLSIAREILNGTQEVLWRRQFKGLVLEEG